MLASSDIRRYQIHIEPTTRCTIACSECPRTLFDDRYEITDCNVDIIADNCKSFDSVLMCGNFGDPIYHPQFHELISAIRQQNPTVSIVIITNGAFRSKEWWEKTASLLVDSDRVVFSIDGLPSNNQLYRTNSKWSTIEVGIRTLRELSPNITMVWKLVVFKYNEDQIQEAMDIAKSYGFDRFKVVISARTNNKLLNPSKNMDDIKRMIDARD